MRRLNFRNKRRALISFLQLNSTPALRYFDPTNEKGKYDRIQPDPSYWANATNVHLCRNQQSQNCRNATDQWIRS